MKLETRVQELEKSLEHVKELVSMVNATLNNQKMLLELIVNKMATYDRLTTPEALQATLAQAPAQTIAVAPSAPVDTSTPTPTPMPLLAHGASANHKAKTVFPMSRRVMV